MAPSESERRRNMMEAFIDFIFETHPELDSSKLYSMFYEKYGWCTSCDDDSDYCDCEERAREKEEQDLLNQCKSNKKVLEQCLAEYKKLKSKKYLVEDDTCRFELLQSVLYTLNLLNEEDEDT